LSPIQNNLPSLAVKKIPLAKRTTFSDSRFSAPKEHPCGWRTPFERKSSYHFKTLAEMD
jgi:hypothetical protein